MTGATSAIYVRNDQSQLEVPADVTSRMRAAYFRPDKPLLSYGKTMLSSFAVRLQSRI